MQTTPGQVVQRIMTLLRGRVRLSRSTQAFALRSVASIFRHSMAHSVWQMLVCAWPAREYYRACISGNTRVGTKQLLVGYTLMTQAGNRPPEIRTRQNLQRRILPANMTKRTHASIPRPQTVCVNVVLFKTFAHNLLYRYMGETLEDICEGVP